MLPAARRRLCLLPLPLRHFTAAVYPTTSATADPTVFYLQSTCALSPTAAARAADSIRLASPESTAQASAVLDLLRRYGFTDAHISATVRKFPIVLVSDPVKTLQPKLDFLASVGINTPLLPRLVSLSPIVLHRSIQDHLAPLFESLRELLGSNARVVTALHHMPFVVRCSPNSTLNLVLPVLRDVHGLPPEDVSKLVAVHPGVIMQAPHRLAEIVQAVKDAGIEPGEPMFVHTFAILSKMKTHTLERKYALYQSLGFQKDSVALMLRRYALAMAISEDKIKENVGFLVGRAGLSLEDIVTYPSMLVRSLESHCRRCAVLAVLRKEEKPEGNHRLAVVLVTTRKRFLQAYVQPHQNEIPDVFRAFNGEIPFEGFSVLE
ncbi:hypothetical protein ZWY2020_043498 [Hordeum vulgare]|uniref:Predicted protein n=1 Tax=Hordeum vulgare subsp. vulgare TaxID=112509 RepID=F2CTT2_HORVV|nr:hypothetical protein ZWY2020_043498 [Hordeum vulgare]BAJ86253.1 predicted protein [Hordeum vulgare subsp. vulgare]